MDTNSIPILHTKNISSESSSISSLEKEGNILLARIDEKLGHLFDYKQKEISEETKKIQRTKSSLIRQGVEGTTAVYLGDIIQEKFKELQQSNEGIAEEQSKKSTVESTKDTIADSSSEPLLKITGFLKDLGPTLKNIASSPLQSLHDVLSKRKDKKNEAIDNEEEEQQSNLLDIKNKASSIFNKIGDSDGDGIGDLNLGNNDDSLVQNRRDALLKAGAAGTAAVYLGDVLKDEFHDLEIGGETGEGGILGSLGALSPMLKTLGPVIKKVGGIALRVAGAAAFVALKAGDVKDSIPQFKEGKIGKGISTALLGDIDKVEGENMLGGIGKQAAAWGGLGMTIGGPIGLLVGVVAGGIAKTIQSAVKATRVAYEEEWDLDVTAIYSEKQKALEEAKGFREKFRALSDQSFTVMGTVFSGAKREAELAGEEGRSKMAGWITGFFDQVVERGIFKTLKKDPETMLLVQEMRQQQIANRREKMQEFSDKVNDFKNQAQNYAVDFMDNIRQKGLSGIKDAQILKDLNTALSTAWVNIKEGAKKKWEDIKEGTVEAWEGFKGKIGEGWGMVTDHWEGFIKDVKKEGMGNYLKNKLKDARDTFKDFWGNIKNAWDKVKNFFKNLGTSIKVGWERLKGGGTGGMSSVADLLGAGSITTEKAQTELAKMSVVKLKAQSEYETKYGAGSWRDIDKKERDAYTDSLAEELSLKMTEASEKGDTKWIEDIIKNVTGDKEFEYQTDLYGGTTSEEPTKVNDFIVTKTGEVIQTHPDDMIFGTKAFDNQSMSNNMTPNNVAVDTSVTDILTQIKVLLSKKPSGNIIQNNFTSRFSPDNILQNGMVGVF